MIVLVPPPSCAATSSGCFPRQHLRSRGTRSGSSETGLSPRTPYAPRADTMSGSSRSTEPATPKRWPTSSLHTSHPETTDTHPQGHKHAHAEDSTLCACDPATGQLLHRPNTRATISGKLFAPYAVWLDLASSDWPSTPRWLRSRWPSTPAWPATSPTPHPHRWDGPSTRSAPRSSPADAPLHLRSAFSVR